uniref:Uncharacterized protein n=1 Tax=Ixodes ricinus TaxID=34613 RepID=A0A6B0U243_IXORI
MLDLQIRLLTALCILVHSQTRRHQGRFVMKHRLPNKTASRLVFRFFFFSFFCTFAIPITVLRLTLALTIVSRAC